MSDADDSLTPDDQLEEVIHIRIENEHVESQPYLQRQSSAVSFHSLEISCIRFVVSTPNFKLKPSL